MTPAARVQMAIELLDKIVASAQRNGAPADTIIAEWFKTRRFAGSGDRRGIRDLIYRAIRAFGEPPETGRRAMLGLAQIDPEIAAAFDGSPYGPPKIGRAENALQPVPMPDWLGGRIDAAEHEALLARAPLDLRVNSLQTSPDAMMALYPNATQIPGLPNGLRIDPPIAIEADDAMRDGLIDVQDAGSQFVVAACQAKPGMTVIDLCAGGGGKTLALGADMENNGRLVACDTDRTRLSRLSPRAARAGVNVKVRLLDGGREAAMLGNLAEKGDVVLVDAPCTGSGTLRRNPEARWRITPDRLRDVLDVQRHVLDLAAPLVRPGGVLVYAVCSLIEREGWGQTEDFLMHNPDFKAEPLEIGRESGPGRILTPGHDGTDGFFVARLIRAC